MGDGPSTPNYDGYDERDYDNYDMYGDMYGPDDDYGDSMYDDYYYGPDEDYYDDDEGCPYPYGSGC